MLFALSLMLFYAPLDLDTGIELMDVFQPSSLDVDRDNQLFIVDEGSAVVVILNPKGEVIATVGRKGQGPGEFQNPLDVALFDDGRFAVSDSVASNVQIFDAERQFVKRLNFTQPVGKIHITPDGNLLITQEPGRNIYLKIGTDFGNRFTIYDLDGNKIRSFGTWIVDENPLFAMMLNGGPTAYHKGTLIYAGKMTNDLIYYRGDEVDEFRFPVTFEPVEPKASQKKYKNANGTFDIQMKIEADTLSASMAVLPNGEILLMRATKSTDDGGEVPYERVRLQRDGQLLERYPGTFNRPILATAPDGKTAYLLHETDEAVVLLGWQP